jgi:hypothetical protein
MPKFTDNLEHLETIESSRRYSRYKTALKLGIVASSTALTVAIDPLSRVKDLVTETAPWVAGGLIAGEAAWIGGAVIMLAAGGVKVGNPLKIRGQLAKIGRDVRNSKLMKSGFAINMAGAVSQFGVASAGVLELPHQSWGLLTLPTYDLALTAIRGAGTWSMIKNSSKNLEGSTTTNEISE